MTHYQFTVVFEQDENGRIIALCPVLRGCYAEGDTEEEARVNIREAIGAHIESCIAYGEAISPEIHSETVSLVL